MGHVDFGVSSATGTEGGGGEEDEWTETNEESVSRVVSSLDFLLEQRGGDNRNSSTATLRRQAEQRSKTAFSLTYNKSVHYNNSTVLPVFFCHYSIVRFIFNPEYSTAAVVQILKDKFCVMGV